jgi:galactose mutarotase-like enzyme
VLRDTTSGAEAEVAPARGGMATRFRVGAVPVLAMDDSTLVDVTKNVRGGIPILFPTAGRLKDDRYGTREMKQHGFARNLPWKVVSRATDGNARVVLELVSNDETRARFPFEFRVEFTYELKGATFTIGQRYENRSKEKMPLHAGFHPYFHVLESEKAKTVVETKATRAFDNVTKQDIPFHGFELTQKEVDLHLHDHGSTESAIVRPGGQRIEVKASSEFTHWVVWTVTGKDFICLEPWTAPGNALNTGERLLWLAPGESRRLWTSVSLA